MSTPYLGPHTFDWEHCPNFYDGCNCPPGAEAGVRKDCPGCDGYGYITHDPTREPCSDCGGVGYYMEVDAQ